MIYGYVPSVLDGTELEINETDYQSLPLPEKYSYYNYMSPILNQGAESTCVPHSISAAYDYYNAMMHPETSVDGKFINKGRLMQLIYNGKRSVGEGTSYK